MSEPEALHLAISILGSQQAAAAVIGIKQQSVSDVLRAGRRAPAEWVLPLERATRAKGREVTRHQLRPDLYPDETVTATVAAQSTPPENDVDMENDVPVAITADEQLLISRLTVHPQRVAAEIEGDLAIGVAPLSIPSQEIPLGRKSEPDQLSRVLHSPSLLRVSDGGERG